MVGWAITFLMLAVFCAFLALFVLVGSAAGVAKILFATFLVMTAITLMAGQTPKDEDDQHP